MEQQIERFIPLAVSAVKTNLAFGSNQDKVKSAYQGYISSYGAAIVQSGLLAATAMFSDDNKKDKTKGDKPCLMDTILIILISVGKIPDDVASLFDYVLANQNNNYLLKQDILKASIAIKLAIRTFELEK